MAKSLESTSHDRMSMVPLMNLTERKNAAQSNQSDQDWSDQELEEFSRDPLENVLMQMRLWPQAITRQQCMRSVVFASAISICIGFISGYVLFLLLYPPHGYVNSRSVDPSLVTKVLDGVNATNIKYFLKNLTNEQHLAGITADNQLVDYISHLWKEQGLQNVHTVPYKVLLSYPNEDKPNNIKIINENGQEIPFDEPRENVKGVTNNFIAFSPQKKIKGKLIYANFGTTNDYKQLEAKGINTSETIALIRQGKINLYQMVQCAKMFNIRGIILYPDPKEYASQGRQNVFPNALWLPATAVKSGSLGRHGDFLTPNFPATDYAYRLNEREVQNQITDIAVHPVSYATAEKLFSFITGDPASDEWVGGLNRTSYNIGMSTKEFSLTVNKNNTIVEIKNVIGMIQGGLEPDRYVLLGNHRDSLTPGAVDAHGGTAVLLELTRVFGKLFKEGWRPQRTLVFCSWSAGALAPIGATEWTEEFAVILRERAVAYLNLDIVVQGNKTLQVVSVPSFQQILMDITKRLPNPNADEVNIKETTVYDSWLNDLTVNNATEKPKIIPKIFYPLMNKGYCNFIHVLGIPILDAKYTNDLMEADSQQSFPLDLTALDTFQLVEKLLDKDFEHHKVVGQLYGLVAIHLADSPVLPFSVNSYAIAIKKIVSSLKNRIYRVQELKNTASVALDALESAVNIFNHSCKDFEAKVGTSMFNNRLALRAHNDRMMHVEKSFIEPRGLPCLPEFKHLIFSRDVRKPRFENSFPCLEEILLKIESGAREVDVLNKLNEEIAALTFYIHSAIFVLQDDQFNITRTSTVKQ